MPPIWLSLGKRETTPAIGSFTKPSDMDQAKKIATDDYLRARLRPDPADPEYIPLSDLLLFIRTAVSGEYAAALDYGCGASPYRSLVSTANYLRADFLDSERLDYRIDGEGRTSAPGSICDLLISTQVLEHIPYPAKSLGEMFRLLRPGGRLILTTHGIWEDHDCPGDFRRWTAEGLALDLRDAGFRVDRMSKLSTEFRAATYLGARLQPVLWASRRSLTGWALRYLQRKSFFRTQAGRHAWADANFPSYRCVEAGVTGHDIYLGLGAVATRPV